MTCPGCVFILTVCVLLLLGAMTRIGGALEMDWGP